MYGNYYDYGDPDLKGLKTRTDEILAGVRSSVAGLTGTGVSNVYKELADSLPKRLAAAGVGNVGSFLKDAYEPYAPTNTSYSDYMADTPSRIASTIGTYQKAYDERKEERMKDLQDILSEMRAYTYGDKTPDGYTPASQPADEGPAMAELKALMPKFKNKNDKKTERSLEQYRDLFGNKFSKSDYKSLVDQGVDKDKIHDNLMAYNQAGGDVGDKVFDLMGYKTVNPNKIKENKRGPFEITQRGDYIIPKGKSPFDFSSLNYFV